MRNVCKVDLDLVFQFKIPVSHILVCGVVFAYVFMHMRGFVCMQNAEDAENYKKRGTEAYDCLHRVKLLLDLIRNRCLSIYHPKQHMSVDERMIATKARIFFKQYMKAKLSKWGIKLFVMADVNGYTVDFKIYTGKSKFQSGKGMSFDVVTSLVNWDYIGSGYVIYYDNF